MRRRHRSSHPRFLPGGVLAPQLYHTQRSRPPFFPLPLVCVEPRNSRTGVELTSRVGGPRTLEEAILCATRASRVLVLYRCCAHRQNERRLARAIHFWRHDDDVFSCQKSTARRAPGQIYIQRSAISGSRVAVGSGSGSGSGRLGLPTSKLRAAKVTLSRAVRGLLAHLSSSPPAPTAPRPAAELVPPH